MSDVSLTSSVRTNLLLLQNTQTSIDRTQTRLATGNKINSAIDGPQSFFAAQGLNQRAGDLLFLKDGLGQAISTINAADAAVTAIEELVDNAFKFSEAGTPVSVSVDSEDGVAVIEVVDQGHGMSNEDVTRIDLFRQFNRSHFEQQGAGLGLYIAKQVVFEIGGEFELCSGPERGTAIKVTLPCADEAIDAEVSACSMVEEMAV